MKQDLIQLIESDKISEENQIAESLAREIFSKDDFKTAKRLGYISSAEADMIKQKMWEDTLNLIFSRFSVYVVLILMSSALALFITAKANEAHKTDVELEKVCLQGSWYFRGEKLPGQGDCIPETLEQVRARGRADGFRTGSITPRPEMKNPYPRDTPERIVWREAYSNARIETFYDP